MNYRIQELKLQAGIQDNPDQEGLNLFAELIMNECYTVVTKYPHLSTSLAGRKMKEHFCQPNEDIDIPPYLRKQGIEQ